MNGWAELAGNSSDPKDVTGRGQLLIHPAALYELPVFIQIFKTLSLATPDKTAFNYALTSFNIGNRMVNFSGIDLIGDAISLRGRGWARFDGPLQLQFYSRPASAWQVPLRQQPGRSVHSGLGWRERHRDHSAIRALASCPCPNSTRPCGSSWVHQPTRIGSPVNAARLDADAAGPLGQHASVKDEWVTLYVNCRVLPVTPSLQMGLATDFSAFFGLFRFPFL